ncbi:hypothetical protein [Erythrobacter sp. YT30]|uniref:hypothetical protein n=1 Tax=Erythrobacter sp. YT30 TaxID=1735012 RepID=UPI00076D37EA|nr:hypothetical protein [Erythrobacter sp. YT30]KWV91363.1 hypothetical protein AUC45_08815 [Erythrobacter sp. YT30]
MKDLTHPLIRISQFAAIKVIPGLANIALIPVLHSFMGAAGFGQFSLFLSFALLSITVFGAIVTQPMYRFLSSDWEGLSNFNGFAFIAAGCGSVAGFLAGAFIGSKLDIALQSGIFVAAAILYTAMTVRLQIENSIRTLAILEALRVLLLFCLIVGFAQFYSEVTIIMAITAFGLSFVFPLLVQPKRLKPSMPRWGWIKGKVRFGYLSAIWLMLAGLPMALSKSFVSVHVSETELGAISANLDMYYRVFSILNIAVAMWMFPAMSKAYDDGNYATARRKNLFGLGVYAAAGAAGGLFLLGGAYIFEPFPAPLAGGLTSLGAVLLACYMLQAMSLAHKPLEMSERLISMIGVMACALIAFVITALTMLGLGLFAPSTAIAISLCSAALVYFSGVWAIDENRKPRA